MNEHSPSASQDPTTPGPDPTTPAEDATQPGPAVTRPRWRPRAGQAAAAATSRTAGWLVAAALAGSLVTLLLVPDRTSPTGLAVVPYHRVAFAAPRGAGPAGPASPGQRAAGQVPPGGKTVTMPGRVQVVLPAQVPPCGFFGPGGPAGLPAYFRGRPPVVKGVVVGPGRRAFRVPIERLPALRRILRKAERPGGPTRRISVHVPLPRRLAGPGGFAQVGPVPGCAIYVPAVPFMPVMPGVPGHPGSRASGAPVSPSASPSASR